MLSYIMGGAVGDGASCEGIVIGDHMDNLEIAKSFFEACEAGEGWNACEKYCDTEATFSAEAVGLDDLGTLKEYVEWMSSLYDNVSSASYEVKGFAFDNIRNVVLVYAVFNAKPHNTEKKFSTNYVYSIEFMGEKISHLTKIWNDSYKIWNDRV